MVPDTLDFLTKKNLCAGSFLYAAELVLFSYTVHPFRHNRYKVLKSGGDVVKYENMEEVYV